MVGAMDRFRGRLTKQKPIRRERETVVLVEAPLLRRGDRRKRPPPRRRSAGVILNDKEVAALGLVLPEFMSLLMWLLLLMVPIPVGE